MSPFAIKAIQLLMSLSLLIVLHELGHFIPAKLFKTRVEKFYLFFDIKFSLFKKKIGDTVYGIGWLPLGGYVKISGMIDESMDKEQMALPPQPWEFRSKPTWQRLIIMLGGVTVNIIVGFVIYICILFVYGKAVQTNDEIANGFVVAPLLQEYGFQEGDKILKVNGEDFPYVAEINRHLFLRDVKTIEVRHEDGRLETISIPEDIGMQMFKQNLFRPFTPRMISEIDSVIAGFPAEKAGLLKGDKILKVNGETARYWHEFTSVLKENNTKPITLDVYRGRDSIHLNVTPNDMGQIGIVNKALAYQDLEYSFSESVSGGVGYGYNILKDYAKQFKYVFTKEGATQVGGFGAIANLFPPQWSWQAFWHTTALISIILAFMNILPIPALDGGHVVFLLYEMISGRKPNEKVMEYAQIAGFFILIALVLFANGNDIYRWLFK